MTKINYRKVWENHHSACLLPNIHIHHIDGNRNNNDPTNLLAVTVEEHYQIHFEQGDYSACSLIEKNHITGGHSHLRKTLGEEEYRLWQAGHASGKSRTNEQKLNHKIGAAKRLSDPDFRSRLSNACRGKRTVVQCPHCGVSGGGGNMRRYHFNNCKNKEKKHV